MDKSESEILEEWDLVSSVYDSEQEKNEAVEKTDMQTEQSETSNNGISENSNNVSEINTEATSENIPDASKKTSESDIHLDQKAQSDNVKTPEPVTAKVEIVSKEIVESDSKPEIELNSEKGTVDEVDEAAVEGDTEEMSEPDTEEITVIETIMYDVKKISDVDSEKNIAANIEKNASAFIKEGSCENNQGTGDTGFKTNGYNECFDVKASDSKDRGEDAAVKVDSVDCSVEQPESSTILPEIYPVLIEQETASIESSSSDIDIIDENMEDSVSSSFLHPLSLSISSSIDTSSVLTSPTEDDKSIRIEEIRLPEKSDSYYIKTETHPKVIEVEKTVPKQSHYDYQQSSEKKSENVRDQPQQHRRDTHSNLFGTLFHFLRNMKCLEWSILGGLVIGLYLTVVFNQTNIFAVFEKEDVVSQMKEMIDDLKYDNKLLKDQMLSEIKNEKVFSSFEHQIKELRKENSRLNHMLYDVAKVLEEQKDAHDKYKKKGSDYDYLTPFRKEMNELKEQINHLKIENEDLQKQLVRIRYASYSQGAKDTSDDKNKKKNEEMTDETNSAEEIPIDISNLKKWNELISLLSKELGLSLENDPQSKGKSYSKSRKNNWYWKIFIDDFKGRFDDLKANITSKFSDYKKVHENALSDVYKFVKRFFTVEKQNNQQFIPPGEESSQWNNFGDFFNDLKDKWSKIKNRVDASDLKSFFKDFKMSGNEETPQYESQKSKSSPYEHNERKPTNVHFESERKPTHADFGSDKKHDKAQKDLEEAKWMFERATLRAELRDDEKDDDDVNWFLKKNKHLSKDEAEKKKY